MILKVAKKTILSLLCILVASVWFVSFFQIKNAIPNTITVDNIINTVSTAGSHLDSMVEDLASGGSRAQPGKTESKHDSVIFFLIMISVTALTGTGSFIIFLQHMGLLRSRAAAIETNDIRTFLRYIKLCRLEFLDPIRKSISALAEKYASNPSRLTAWLNEPMQEITALCVFQSAVFFMEQSS